MTIPESLTQMGTALVVLGVGAVLSYYLGPRITRRWEEGKKKVEIRVDLFERALGVTEEAVFYGSDMIGHFEISGLPNSEIKSLNPFFEGLYAKERGVLARLRMYMPDLEDDWRQLSKVISNYVLACYDFSHNNNGERLNSELANIRQVLGDEYLSEVNLQKLMRQYDSTNWNLVEEGIGKRSSKFLQRLKTEKIHISY